MISNVGRDTRLPLASPPLLHPDKAVHLPYLFYILAFLSLMCQDSLVEE